MGDWVLGSPEWLWLVLLVPAGVWLRGRRGQRVWLVPHVSQWWGQSPLQSSQAPMLLAVVGIALLMVAMARPQRVEERNQVRQSGYDIVLAIDLSGSMLAEDYREGGKRINRLQAVKPILEAFMNRRQGDRIGVVAFGGRSYTMAPLSFDHDWLREQVERLEVGLVEDGTAVGDALGLAVSRLGQSGRMKEGLREGGFVILLTDGANNSGLMDPIEAARLAAAKNIPVYTIGAGRDGRVPMPVFDDAGRKLGYRDVMSDLDEPTLREMARLTGGRYFRATDSGTVNAAFAAIDQERKIEFDAKANLRTHELYEYLAWPGLILVLFAFALARPGRREWAR